MTRVERRYGYLLVITLGLHRATLAPWAIAHDKNLQTTRSVPTQLSDGYLHTYDGHAERVQSGIAGGSID